LKKTHGYDDAVDSSQVSYLWRHSLPANPSTDRRNKGTRRDCDGGKGEALEVEWLFERAREEAMRR